jgi:CAAX prenyl protease-like protein
LRFPRQWLFTLAVAVLVLAIWISPQELFRFPGRFDGFNPRVFPPGSAIYWGTISLRFLRLVVVVPLLEEIFWRGFLLRVLIDENFESVPIGSFSWLSFSGVSLCFGLAHWGPDFPAALITGALYNLVAIRTRSLSSCVLAHAVTNLLLGCYIMKTLQWGFW